MRPETNRLQGMGPGQTTRKGPFAIKTARGTPIIHAKKRKSKPPKAIARTQLVIRAEVDPKSKRVGSLLAGSVFFVLDSRALGDSATRVRVALRDNAKPCGWVTAQRDDAPFLDIVEGELRSKLAATSGSSPNKAVKGRSFVSSVDNADIHFTLEELQALSQKQLDLASEIELSLDATSAGLAAQLGETLIESSANVKEFLQDLDRADRGLITKADFRRSIRQMVPAVGTSSNNEVDSLFDSWDQDKSGSLDVPEMKEAFGRLMVQAKERKAANAVKCEKIERLRRHAEVTQKAEAATQGAEAVELELRERLERPSVESRLGILLVKRNVKVGDMVAKWDVDHDGALDKKEFLKNVTELGLDASTEEFEALYIKVDTDGSGMLEVPELVAYLKENQAMRAMEEEQEKALAKKAADRRKLAKQAQILAFRENENDEEEQRKEEEEERAAAEAKAKAELEAAAKAKEAKKAAKKARKQAKEEEKLQMEEKINQKRGIAGDVKAESVASPEAAAASPAKEKLKEAIDKVVDGDGRVDKNPPPKPLPASPASKMQHGLEVIS